MPTLMMSAPARISSSTISPVTTFPAWAKIKISTYPRNVVFLGHLKGFTIRNWPLSCAKGTSPWRLWRSGQSALNNRLPRPRRCTSAAAPPPPRPKSSQSHRLRSPCWLPHSERRTQKSETRLPVNTPSITSSESLVQTAVSTSRHSGCFSANSNQSSTV